MEDQHSRSRSVLRQLLQRPDALMLELGAGGERLVARMRVGLSILLLALPLVNAAGGGDRNESLIGLLGAILAIVMAFVWLSLARQSQRYRWVPYASATYDITLTTLVLALLAWQHPPAGLNSMVVWAFYLIAVVLTALRNDGRLTLYTGALAMLQYAVLAGIVMALSPPDRLVSADYGTASLLTVVQRLVLVLIMTGVTTTMVMRMQRLVEMSGTDGLTGLPNRTWLLHRFPLLLDAARAEGGSLSVCVIDLDRFKRINDELGHLAGDRALQHVVKVIGERLEHGDRLTRLGGEEFALVMRLPIGRAWELLEVMRREVAGRPFQPEPDGDLMHLTFSAGVAAWPQDGNDLSALLRRADARLRRAKNEGRNRVLARDD